VQHVALLFEQRKLSLFIAGSWFLGPDGITPKQLAKSSYMKTTIKVVS
jgi:hypothetical protein